MVLNSWPLSYVPFRLYNNFSQVGKRERYDLTLTLIFTDDIILVRLGGHFGCVVKETNIKGATHTHNAIWVLWTPQHKKNPSKWSNNKRETKKAPWTLELI